MDLKQFYYVEWKMAEKSGDDFYSEKCKDKYIQLAKLEIIQDRFKKGAWQSIVNNEFVISLN